MPDTLPFPSAHVRLGSNSGQPLTRRDGLLKVTGAATYAADNHPAGMLHAVVAVSTIARGRVAFARRRGGQGASRRRRGDHAGEPPAAGAWTRTTSMGLFGFRIEALQNDRVRYAKQPIALVVAETLEAATEGARLLAPTYETEPARIGFDDGERYEPPAVGIGAAAELRSRRPRGRPCRGHAPDRDRATRPRPSITTRWSRMPSSPNGTATG